MPNICITLMTDFGLSDPYVAAMKGAILTVNPGATLVDITHQIQAQNVLHGSFVLAEAALYFPPATIHVAVVDPGVGTQRRVLCAEANSHRFIAPDNGLLTEVLRRWPATRLFEVTRRKYFRPSVSSTFHGRDIMAPVAGHLSLGLDPAELGPPVQDIVRRPLPVAQRTAEAIDAAVLWVDHFGNVVTNVPRADLADAEVDRLTLALGPYTLRGLAATYECVEPGQPLMLVGSSGLVEIAVREGSAAQQFGLRCGQPLRFVWR